MLHNAAHIFSPESGYLLYIVVMIAYLPLLIFALIANWRVNSIFDRYDRQMPRSGATGYQAARDMLNRNGLYGTKIIKVRGSLTDYYDPSKDILGLSERVYDARSVSALGVACHEAGHALQYAHGYLFAKFRTKLVPVVNFANRLIMPILLIGMLFGLLGTAGILGDLFVWAGIVLFGLSLLFSLITLPTEFNASKRALQFLEESQMDDGEAVMSKKVLNAAAMTYVVSFLLSTIYFLRFVALLLMRRSR